MEIKQWLQMWEEERTPFHQMEVEPLLKRHHQVLGKQTVLVPLCGKSMDMKWLLDLGLFVVGVEASSLACELFFKDNGLDVQITQENGFQIYRGQAIEIFCGDIFEWKPSFSKFKAFSGLYDRASWVAFDPHMQQQYAAFVTHFLSLTQASPLIVSFEYPQEKLGGPPFSTPLSAISNQVGPSWHVRELERVLDKAWGKKHPKYADFDFYQIALTLEPVT